MRFRFPWLGFALPDVGKRLENVFSCDQLEALQVVLHGVESCGQRIEFMVEGLPTLFTPKSQAKTAEMLNILHEVDF